MIFAPLDPSLQAAAVCSLHLDVWHAARAAVAYYHPLHMHAAAAAGCSAAVRRYHADSLADSASPASNAFSYKGRSVHVVCYDDIVVLECRERRADVAYVAS